MKLSDSNFQELLAVSDKTPKKSERIIGKYRKKYGLDYESITSEYLRGFAYAIRIVEIILMAEKLSEVKPNETDN